MDSPRSRHLLGPWWYIYIYIYIGSPVLYNQFSIAPLKYQMVPVVSTWSSRQTNHPTTDPPPTEGPMSSNGTNSSKNWMVSDDGSNHQIQGISFILSDRNHQLTINHHWSWLNHQYTIISLSIISRWSSVTSRYQPLSTTNNQILTLTDSEPLRTSVKHHQKTTSRLVQPTVRFINMMNQMIVVHHQPSSPRSATITNWSTTVHHQPSAITRPQWSTTNQTFTSQTTMIHTSTTNPWTTMIHPTFSVSKAPAPLPTRWPWCPLAAPWSLDLSGRGRRGPGSHP